MAKEVSLRERDIEYRLHQFFIISPLLKGKALKVEESRQIRAQDSHQFGPVNLEQLAHIVLRIRCCPVILFGHQSVDNVKLAEEAPHLESVQVVVEFIQDRNLASLNHVEVFNHLVV